MILNGIEKSALLLMSIGSDQAGEILKHLTPFEVQELISTMVNMGAISNEKLNETLHECYDLAIRNDTFHCHNSDSYLIDILTRVMGEKEGNTLLKKELDLYESKMCLKALNSMKSEKVAFLLNDEHPQIITIILMHLNKNQASQVLSCFSKKKRAEIILRITEFNGIEESSLIEFTKVINNLLKNKKLILSEHGGIKNAVKILNCMKIQHEKETIENIIRLDENAANKIIEEIFLFENIINIEDDYIKKLNESIEEEKLYIALQKSTSFVRKKFFKNMSEKKSVRLSKRLEKKSYISDVSIKNEQKLILIMIKSIINNENNNENCISLENIGRCYGRQC